MQEFGIFVAPTVSCFPCGASAIGGDGFGKLEPAIWLSDNLGQWTNRYWSSRFLLIFAGVALTLWNGCRKSADDVLPDYLAYATDTIAVLKSVKDEETAKAAASKLKQLAARRVGLDKRVADLSEPQQATFAQNQEFIGSSLAAATELIRVAGLQIKDPEFADALKVLEGQMH
jgi:hypothetical protein